MKGSPVLGVIQKQRRTVGGFVAPLRLCVLQCALQVARSVQGVDSEGWADRSLLSELLVSRPR